MPLLMLTDLPRYECLLAAAEQYPSLDPTAIDAFLHVLRTADLVFNEKGRFLSGRNLSQGRFTLLMLLHRCENEFFTPADLAAKAGVTRATITGLIDTLAKDGLVVRKADARDRRTIHLHLTPVGQAFIESMLPDWFRCVSAMIQPLNEGERKQLVHLLQKIQEGLTPPPNSLPNQACAIPVAPENH